MLSTVLIIDKRKELSVKYKKCIDDSNTNTVITRTLKEAMHEVQNLEPDMIIISDSIDEKLPDFCKKLRAMTYNSRPVIIGVSKSADISDRIAVLEAGADDFISEPVDTDEFKSRIKAHLRRDIESNLDMKTLLPSKKYVRKTVKRAMFAENKAILLASVRNLKEYANVYTELAADKLLQTFVAIVKSALDENDFVGRLDDTNFVIVTNKYSAEKIAEFLVFAFDTVVPKFYSENDAKRGYVLPDSGEHAGMRINFVSILVGGITEGLNSVSKPEILLDRLKEVRNLAKIPIGSNYAMERIKLNGINSVIENINNKEVYVCEKDEALKYLIKTTLELQGYSVIENINSDSENQPALIIMDSGDNLDELDFCRSLKANKNFINTKIIVTTTIHDKATILDSGADLYLPKPYEISDLIRWVEYLLNIDV